MSEKSEFATFAGGCFWCLKNAFENLEGVLSIYSGFTGGYLPNPTYEEVLSGISGHYEAIQIEYNPKQLVYTHLLTLFWQSIDPTDAQGQFSDRGNMYRSAIFCHNHEQLELALESRTKLDTSGIFEAKIVTDIFTAYPFYRAEAYHQTFTNQNPMFYCQYTKLSGRDDFLKKFWS